MVSCDIRHLGVLAMMKKGNRHFLTVLLFMTTIMLVDFANAVGRNEKLKPFVLAYNGPGELELKTESVKSNLEQAGFQVVGDYSPYANSRVIIATSNFLQKISQKSEFGSFGAVQRISVVDYNGKIQIAYINPVYLSQAYRLKDDLQSVRDKLNSAVGNLVEFGARGVKARKLRKYHYTFGMEYFDEPYRLAEYDSYSAAVKAVEKNLSKNNVGVAKVYRLDIKGTNKTLFGVSRTAPTEDEKYMDDVFIMGNVDFKELKQAAYLPYEILVEGNQVLALHMRFRMAVHFPDLKMMGSNSFMNLMPSPNAIQRALTLAVGGSVDEF